MAPRRRAPRPWYRTRAYRLTRTIVVTVVLVVGAVNVDWGRDADPLDPTGVRAADAADGAGDTEAGTGARDAEPYGGASGAEAETGARGAGAPRAPAPLYFTPPSAMPSAAGPTSGAPSAAAPAGRGVAPAETVGPGGAGAGAGGAGRPGGAKPGESAGPRSAVPSGRASTGSAEPLGPASEGAAGPTGPAKPPGGAEAARPARTPTLPPSPPKKLLIPSLGVDAPVMGLQLDDKGRLPAPPDDEPKLVGWYSAGPAPGGPGTAVVVGHRDTRTGPAVFAALEMVKRGRIVEVRRADGRTAVYTVDAVRTYEKSRFPDEVVYGTRDRPELRLITCGGAYDRRKGYSSNVVVFAHLTGTRGPGAGSR